MVTSDVDANKLKESEMTRLLQIASLVLVFATTNALAAYGDHALLRGQSWGPDAQILAGTSAAEERERTASQRAREHTGGLAVAGETTARPAREAGVAGPVAPTMSPFAPHDRGNRSADSALWGVGN
jgi:hypothetical protein